MQIFFRYNWQVRQQWFDWCEQLTHQALFEERVGGVGSIAKTLHHIIDVEWSWIRRLQGKSDQELPFSSIQSLADLRKLNCSYHKEVEYFVDRWQPSYENDVYKEGQPPYDTWGIVMRHLVAHEIHHIGQLSVWARALQLEPISANVIGRGLEA